MKKGINAYIYMVLARLIHYLVPNERITGVSPRWLAKIFVAADMVSFFVQAAGGSMIANDEDADVRLTGQRVYMAGIGVQLLFVVVFAGVWAVFRQRLERRMRDGRLVRRSGRSMAWVRPLVWTVLGVIGLIVVCFFFFSCFSFFFPFFSSLSLSLSPWVRLPS